MKTLSFMRLKQKSVPFGDTAILYQATPFRVAGKYLDSRLIRTLKGPVWYRHKHPEELTKVNKCRTLGGEWKHGGTVE